MAKNVLELELTKKSSDWVENIEALSKLDITPSTKGNTKEDELSILTTIGELGFTNSKCIVDRAKVVQDNIAFNAAVRRATECLSFIMEVRDYFGPGVIVVKREDMIEIMRKYDLICGTFSNYLGIIPEENVLEIKAVKDKIQKLRRENCIVTYDRYSIVTYDRYKLLHTAFNSYKLRMINGITMGWDRKKEKNYSLDKKYLMELNTLPLLLQSNSCSYSDSFSEYLNSILPQNEYNKISSFNTEQIDNLFIIAPSKEMNNREKKIKIHAFRPRTEDPLICSLTKEGVVVFSKWGKEAEDKAFNKYNQLFESLKLK